MPGDIFFRAVARSWFYNKKVPASINNRDQQLWQCQCRSAGRGRPSASRNYCSPSAGESAAAATSLRSEKQQGFFFRVLFGGRDRRGVRGTSYVFAVAAAATAGCLGAAGLYVVLADAGQEVGSGTLLAADSQDPLQKKKKKVVSLGTGWGGISFLKTLDCKLFDVQIVSPRNYFVFTPLLPSVTVGTVEARSVTEPIRRIIRKKDAEFHEAECIKIDPENKQVICKDVSELDFERKPEFALDYDYLVIAVGATSNTFGTKGVDEYCHFLKDVEDAEKIREQIVDIFETASLPHLSPEVRYILKSRPRTPLAPSVRFQSAGSRLLCMSDFPTYLPVQQFGCLGRRFARERVALTKPSWARFSLSSSHSFVEGGLISSSPEFFY